MLQDNSPGNIAKWGVLFYCKRQDFVKMSSEIIQEPTREEKSGIVREVIPEMKTEVVAQAAPEMKPRSVSE